MIDNRTVAAVIPLHYGLAFLPYAMRSVADVVDEFLIMYTPHPNHGALSSPIPCPDARDDLFDAAFQVAPDKTRWFEYGHWPNEGAQFDDGRCRTHADVVVKLDADELWMPGLLEAAVRQGLDEQVREVRVLLIHCWRAFHRGFAHDPAAPGRIYLREFSGGETTFHPADDGYRIWHFGYAQPLSVVRYKMGIHGHKSEFKNAHWFDEVYAANRQTDCHPIGMDSWSQVEPLTPPAFLMDHPFAGLEIIE